MEVVRKRFLCQYINDKYNDKYSQYSEIDKIGRVVSLLEYINIPAMGSC